MPPCATPDDARRKSMACGIHGQGTNSDTSPSLHQPANPRFTNDSIQLAFIAQDGGQHVSKMATMLHLSIIAIRVVVRAIIMSTALTY